MNHNLIGTVNYDDELGRQSSATCSCGREFNGYPALLAAIDAWGDHAITGDAYERRIDEMTAHADLPLDVRSYWHSLLHFFGFDRRSVPDPGTARNPAPRWLDRADAPGGD